MRHEVAEHLKHQLHLAARDPDRLMNLYITWSCGGNERGRNLVLNSSHYQHKIGETLTTSTAGSWMSHFRSLVCMAACQFKLISTSTALDLFSPPYVTAPVLAAAFAYLQLGNEPLTDLPEAGEGGLGCCRRESVSRANTLPLHKKQYQ